VKGTPPHPYSVNKILAFSEMRGQQHTWLISSRQRGC
jgi:hypothetical protein